MALSGYHEISYTRGVPRGVSHRWCPGERHITSKRKDPFHPMKKRFPFGRVFGLLFLAAGAGVAVLATREEGREQLSKFGEFIGKTTTRIGAYVSESAQYASKWVEQARHQDEPYAKLPTYTHAQNGTRQSEMTVSR